MVLCENDRYLTVADTDPAFRFDVLEGLSRQPRAIPPRWLYDHFGSELFEAITTLPEYYPTRTERSILSRAANEIAALTGGARAVVEFGSGSSAKTPILLSAVNPSAYVPIDISSDFLWESVELLSERFPNLAIYPVEGDFTGALRLPPAIRNMPRLGFFPGSTIGNRLVPAAVDLLRTMAKTLGAGSMLLIGIDRIKDTDVLLPAYDDKQGVTAAFNLNLLHRINRELGALCRWMPSAISRAGTRLRRGSKCTLLLIATPTLRLRGVSSRSQRVRRFTLKTASNTDCARPVSSCGPAAGLRSRIGPMTRNCSQ